jgi:hypothetical protein
MNGANWRVLLPMNPCELSALLVLCTSKSPWGICWPLHTRGGVNAGMSVSEYVVVESCGAWHHIVSVWTRQGENSLDIWRGIVARIDYSQMMLWSVCSSQSIKTYRVSVVL